MKFVLIRMGIFFMLGGLCTILSGLTKVPPLTVWQLCSIVVPAYLAGVVSEYLQNKP